MRFPYIKIDMWSKNLSSKAIRIYEDDLVAFVRSELQGRAAASTNTAYEANSHENVGSLQAQIASLEQQIEKKWSAKKDAFRQFPFVYTEGFSTLCTVFNCYPSWVTQ